MATVYGIDLGTTNSCIAKCDESGVPQALRPEGETYGRDYDRDYCLPSIVYFDEDGTPIVGEDAKVHLTTKDKSERTFSNFKRSLSKKVCETEDATNSFSPIEGSAYVLHKLLEMVPQNEHPIEAVISIPASYVSDQRQYVKTAARLAGIEVLGLIHEPTAAALCYGLLNSQGEKRKFNSGETVLVFDLGGGTLDVSVVKNNAGKYEVLGLASDESVFGEGNHIGGINWDNILVKLVAARKNIDLENLPKHKLEFLRQNAEQCKRRWTNSTQTAAMKYDYEEDINIEYADFKEMSNLLLNKCVEVVNAAIEDANKECKKKDGKEVIIDYFIMAGGSSNLKMIKKVLIDKFRGRIGNNASDEDWLRLIERPESAIAKGAALKAYRLKNGIDVGVEEKSSHSYGTLYEDKEGHTCLKNLILKSDPMIFKSKEIKFSKKEVEKESIVLDIYENEYNEGTIVLKGNEHTKDGGNKLRRIDNHQKLKLDNTFSWKVSRDRDGVISICVSDGKNSQSYEIDPTISNEVIERIEHNVELMDEYISKYNE